jgi:glycosyltransferase involved in cell wall biosynthesis
VGAVVALRVRELVAEAGTRLASRGALRIVLLSDLGFEYGAGTAMRRQAQSLLLDGHDVAVVCCGRMHEARVVPALDPGAGALAPRGRALRGAWLGVQSVPGSEVHDPGRPRACDLRVIDRVCSLEPDLVIAGNLHWAGWSVSILAALVDRGIATVAYMHDQHYVTGRCACAYACSLLRSGCDASCPTSTQYPALEPSLIADEWTLRRHVFVERGVPLVANSRWTAGMARDALGEAADIALVPLGVDTELFSPIAQGVARAVLGLDGRDKRPLVLFGSVDTSNPEKGGPLVRRVIESMRGDRVRFACFGYGSDRYPEAHSLGYIGDERVMPILYGACDCYLTLSAMESFGQTVLEAAACARPIVSRRGGGVVDIAQEGVNARTVADADVKVVVAVLREILADRRQASALGEAGRALALARFSLDAQAAAWRAWIAGHGRERPPEGGASSRAGTIESASDCESGGHRGRIGGWST